MKARIALQNERYDIAAKAAKEIIDNGPYDLYDYEKLYHLEGDIAVSYTHLDVYKRQAMCRISINSACMKVWRRE